MTVLLYTKESQGKQRVREEERSRGRTSPIQRGRIRQKGGQKKRMCEGKNEPYSPSSYLPKKVKLNREKEKKRKEGAGQVLYREVELDRKGDRKRECLNVRTCPIRRPHIYRSKSR